MIAGLTVATGTPSINSCTFAGNVGYGINVTGGTPAINGSTFTDNTDYAVATSAALQLNGMANLSATGNGTGGTRNAVLVRGASVTESRRWYAAALPYVIAGAIHVGGSAAPILTIDAGNTVKLQASSEVTVNWTGPGSMQAIGTATAPIAFTAENSTTAGFWRSFYFGSSGSVSSRVQHAVVEYGGTPSLARGGFHVAGGSPEFDNVTFRNNMIAGLTVAAGTPSISSCTLSANVGYGINVTGGTPAINGSTFTNNTDYAVATSAALQLNGMANLSATGNGTGGTRNAVLVRGASVTESRRWYATALPYVIAGAIHVGGSAAPILTIDAGNTMKLQSSSEVTVNWTGPGSIQAIGTATAPIAFTAENSTTAGFWRSFYFGNSGSVSSRVQHAVVEYGGTPSLARGGFHVAGRSPEFDNVTFRGNLIAGLSVEGSGAPVVTNCTFTTNTGAGVDVVFGSLSISNATFTSNTAHALRMAATTDLTSAGGLSASGQPAGRDAIYVTGGTVTANRTWPHAGLPYVVSASITVAGGATPVMTIGAGVTVKFEPGAQFIVNFQGAGAFRAIGTAAAPILFTSNNPTPTPGSWIAISIGGAAPTTSELAYATVEYGGHAPLSRGGLQVAGSTVRLDRVSFRNNAVAGLTITGGASVMTECAFTGNPAGMTASGTYTADARRSYWGAANGPSGSGFGSGQSIAANIAFEPWLTTAPTTPQFITTAAVRNRTFNPTINTVSSVLFTTVNPVEWTFTVTNSANTTVRTITGSGSPADASWDGRDGTGTLVANGTYNYVLSATNAAPLAGRMIVDSARRLTSTATVTSMFSPNADGILDVAIMQGAANFDANWTISIKNGSGTMVRQLTAIGQTVSIAWDGRDTPGVLQPDGSYSLDVERSAGTDTATNVLSTIIDVTPPVATIVSPSVGETTSNVYRNGSADVPIIGTAADLNLDRWTLDYGSGGTPSAWTTLQTGTAGVSAATLGTWKSLDFANGPYTIRLQVWDKVGMRSVTTHAATLSNFKMTKNADQLKPTANQTVTYTSTVPFPLTETVVIRNALGQTVRTIFSGARAMATYTDIWNGRDDSSALVPDGAYFYTASVTDGTNSMTWDLTNQMRTEGFLFNYPTLSVDFDPFNNKPLSVTYTFTRPGRIYVIFSPYDHPTPCVAPAYCWKNQMYQESGTHTLYWTGVDDSGALRPDLVRTSVTSFMDSFPKNAVVVYGAKPVLSPVAVTPAFYGPATGHQTVSFNLATYQNQTANVEVSFRNMTSQSVLRTVTATNVAPGVVSITWDGRADNGMWVAPGGYIVTATATDGIGNRVSQQIVTSIAY